MAKYFTLLVVLLANPSPAISNDLRKISFDGEATKGQKFEYSFGEYYKFVLEPLPHGWEVFILEAGRPENLARLTPPFHSITNPRYIEGWHFRNADNTGPNMGSINAPQTQRNFIYSPEVGKSIDYPMTPKEAEALNKFWNGELRIRSYELDNPAGDSKAKMRKMQFTVSLEWEE